jgi:hypothetical protein
LGAVSFKKDMSMPEIVHEPAEVEAVGHNRLTVLAGEISAADGRYRRSAHEAAAAAVETGNLLIEPKALGSPRRMATVASRQLPNERENLPALHTAGALGPRYPHGCGFGHKAASEALSRVAAPEYEQHPICACYPPMSESEFSYLCASIAKRGLFQPITLYEGQILDGWQRELACRKTGSTPRYEEFTGDWDAAIRFTISRNVIRQHLTVSQRAMIVTRREADGGAEP